MKGSMLWNLQRYSSLFILIYLVYLVGFIYSNDLDFFSWSDFFLSFEIRIISSLAFFLIILHAFIGLWTVGTDYLTNRTLGFLNKSLSEYANLFRKMYYFFFVLLGTIYLSVVLYIIWL
jgi:succinate dehydrogenase / fumarate reductase membrane anchor subunit|tara:strand:+ start:1661 stop:2017 length:357 start_codon:yes stop_codon:yes gene_type:complete